MASSGELAHSTYSVNPNEDKGEKTDHTTCVWGTLLDRVCAQWMAVRRWNQQGFSRRFDPPTDIGKLIAGRAFHQAGAVNAKGVTHSDTAESRIVDSTKNNVVAVRPLVYFRGQRYGFDSRVGGPQGVMMRQDSNLTWQVVPNSAYYHGTTSGNVFSTAVYDDELYVAGFLDSIGGIRVNHIAKWDGITWRSVGTGIDNTEIFSMVEYANELYVGGNFQVAGGVPVHHLARWNGSTWRDVGGGMDAQVSKLEVYNNELYIRGNFDHAGGQRIPHLAKWNGTTFSTVAEDPNPPGE